MKYLIGFLFLAGFSTLFSCKDEDLTVDPSNSGALSKAIVPISNSTRVLGDMPSSSSDASAPKLASPTEKGFMFGRSSGGFTANVLSGNVAGLYVQVKGADEHFKLLTSSPEPGFGFVIENNAQTGSFVMQYAVFDAQDRVSNIVEQTIVTMNPGGPDNFFPSDSISVKKVTLYVSQFEISYVVGVPKINSSKTYLNCLDENKIVDVAEETSVDKYKFIFDKDGNLGMAHRSHYKTFDASASNSSCTVKYNFTYEAINYEGWWGYSSEHNRLLLEYRPVTIIDGVRNEGPEIRYDYSVQKTGSKIILTSSTVGSQYDVVEFE